MLFMHQLHRSVPQTWVLHASDCVLMWTMWFLDILSANSRPDLLGRMCPKVEGQLISHNGFDVPPGLCWNESPCNTDVVKNTSRTAASVLSECVFVLYTFLRKRGNGPQC